MGNTPESEGWAQRTAVSQPRPRIVHAVGYKGWELGLTSHTDTASYEWVPTHCSYSAAPSRFRLPCGQKPNVRRSSARPEQCALAVWLFPPISSPSARSRGGHRCSAQHQVWNDVLAVLSLGNLGEANLYVPSCSFRRKSKARSFKLVMSFLVVTGGQSFSYAPREVNTEF